MKEWVTIALAAVVGIVVLVSAGTWLYINVIREPPAERLTLDAAEATGTPATVPPASASSAPASSAGAAGIDGTWTVSDGSQAGYRVAEILNGQSTEAVGRSSVVTGQLTIGGTQATAAMLTVDMTTVTSDESRRDGQFRGRIMDVASHPTSTFTLTSPIDFREVPADGARLTAEAIVA